MFWRIAAHLWPVLGAALVVALGVTFLFVFPFAPKARPAHSRAQAAPPAPATPAATPAPTPPPAPTPAPAGPPGGLTPVRLVIPTAQVNATIESVGRDAQGVIGVPAQPMDSAWFNGSPAPGQPGNSIIDGHLDWWTGPGVFGHLADVKTGDQIQFVRQDGSQVMFTVTGEQDFSANAQMPASMLTTSGPSTVTLITCSGAWDSSQGMYNQRLVVSASLS